MNISELTEAIEIKPFATTPLLAEKVESPATSDTEVISLFNEAKSKYGNRHDLTVISKNLFSRKLRQFNLATDTKKQIAILADLLAIIFFNG